MNASSPEGSPPGKTRAPRQRHVWIVATICVVLAGVVVVARKPSGSPPVSLQFVGRDTARIRASPIGIFAISNRLSRPLLWSLKVEPLQPDANFDLDQMLSSFAAAGLLAPGEFAEFRTLVPGGEGTRFRVVVFESVRSSWFERRYFALGQSLPVLLRLWRASPQTTRTIYTSVMGDPKQQ